MDNKEVKTQEKAKQKFDFKNFFRRLFLNNIVYKLSAVFLGFLLWLFLGFLNSGV